MHLRRQSADIMLPCTYHAQINEGVLFPSLEKPNAFCGMDRLLHPADGSRPGHIHIPTAMLFLNMALVLMISSISYDAGMKRRCIFSVLVCAVWMPMEITTDIILRLIGMDGWELQTADGHLADAHVPPCHYRGALCQTHGPEGHPVPVCRRGPRRPRRKRIPDAQHLPDNGAA